MRGSYRIALENTIEDFVSFGYCVWWVTVGAGEAIYLPAACVVVERTINQCDCIGIKAVYMTPLDPLAIGQLESYAEELEGLGRGADSIRQAATWLKESSPELPPPMFDAVPGETAGAQTPSVAPKDTATSVAE